MDKYDLYTEIVWNAQPYTGTFRVECPFDVSFLKFAVASHGDSIDVYDRAIVVRSNIVPEQVIGVVQTGFVADIVGDFTFSDQLEADGGIVYNDGNTKNINGNYQIWLTLLDGTAITASSLTLSLLVSCYKNPYVIRPISDKLSLTRVVTPNSTVNLNVPFLVSAVKISLSGYISVASPTAFTFTSSLLGGDFIGQIGEFNGVDSAGNYVFMSRINKNNALIHEFHDPTRIWGNYTINVDQAAVSNNIVILFEFYR